MLRRSSDGGCAGWHCNASHLKGMIMKKLFLGAACALFASAAVQANEPERSGFSFDRDALVDIAEAERVYFELAEMVEDLCRRENGRQRYQRAMRSCMRNTMARAVAQIDAPTVYAVYDDQHGRRTAFGRLASR